MPPDNEKLDKGFQLREQLGMIRENWWLILACLAVTLVAVGLYTSSREEEYASTARLLTRDDSVEGTSLPSGPTEDPDVRAATDLELASLPTIASQTARKLKLPYGGDTLLANLDAKSKANSRLITITVTDPSPRLAQRIANSFAAEYVAFRANRDRRRYARAIAAVNRELRSARSAAGTISGDARIRRLRSQRAELDLLAKLQRGDAEVVQRAGLPSDPVSPKPLQNYALGTIFGLLLGFGIATLRDRLDKRIKREDQLRELLPDVPVLASLPLGSEKRKRPVVAEAFRNLQTNLTFLDVDGTLQSLLVTSAADGEGKSTTSLNLALAMAERDQSVMLVDADLRRPGISELLGLNGSEGVSSFLSGQAESIDECIERVQIDGASTNGAGPAMALGGEVSVVPAGPMPPNPQALLGAASLDALLAQTRSRAERVVIDGAPLGPFSDMLPVAKRADGIVIVVRLNHSRRDQVQLLYEKLRQAGLEPLGIVLFAPQIKQPRNYYTRPAAS